MGDSGDNFDLTRDAGQPKRRRLRAVPDTGASSATPRAVTSTVAVESGDPDPIDAGPIKETLSRIQVPRRADETARPPDFPQLTWREARADPVSDREPVADLHPSDGEPVRPRPDGEIDAIAGLDLRRAASALTATRSRRPRRLAAVALVIACLLVGAVVSLSSSAGTHRTLAMAPRTTTEPSHATTSTPASRPLADDHLLGLTALAQVTGRDVVQAHVRQSRDRTVQSSQTKVNHTASTPPRSVATTADSTAASTPAASTGLTAASAATTPVSPHQSATPKSSTDSTAKPASGPTGLGEPVGDDCSPQCSAH